jgi:quercetin dioxygenase-like cupin family protein
MRDEKEWVEQLKKEGYVKVQTVNFEPNMAPNEHTHEVESTHVFLKGKVTVSDKEGTKIFKAGDQITIPAGTTHTVSTGQEGCTMIMGVRDEENAPSPQSSPPGRGRSR